MDNPIRNLLFRGDSVGSGTHYVRALALLHVALLVRLAPHRVGLLLRPNHVMRRFRGDRAAETSRLIPLRLVAGPVPRLRIVPFLF